MPWRAVNRFSLEGKSLRTQANWRMLLVALIAGASAYVVRGGLPEPAAIERALRSIGL
mgnify:CR=1 FL=1